MNNTLTHNHSYPFLRNAGAMGELIFQNDWSLTSIGAIEHWPQSFRTTLSVLLHSGVPMFLVWGAEQVCFYNDAFNVNFKNNGHPPSVGKKGEEGWPQGWSQVKPVIEKIMSQAIHFHEEEQAGPFGVDEDQKLYWSFSYCAAYDENGSTAGTLITCIKNPKRTTITDQDEKLALQKMEALEKERLSLIASNNYLQKIIDLFNTAMQVLEPVIENDEVIDFRFKLTNAAYAAYANAAPADIQGKKVSELFPNYFQTSSFTNVVKTYKTGNKDTWEIHYDQDGLDLYNEMTATKLGDDVVLQFTDFTKLKHLELALVDKIAALERSNQNLEEFTHAVSHDLKEPIRKIRLFNEKLRDQLAGNLPDTALITLNRIESAAARMEDLINDLLQYSEMSDRSREKETVNLDKKIQTILEDLELQIEEKRAIIHVGNLPEVKGYERQLQQMFQNLLGNALKYAKKTVPPEISIMYKPGAENETAYHVIEIKDNGIGFEQKYADKIFEMFSRLHAQAEYGGTGIGLSIVKKVVENHQGFIQVSSKPGEGSCFTIYLSQE